MLLKNIFKNLKYNNSISRSSVSVDTHPIIATLRSCWAVKNIMDRLTCLMMEKNRNLSHNTHIHNLFPVALSSIAVTSHSSWLSIRSKHGLVTCWSRMNRSRPYLRSIGRNYSVEWQWGERWTLELYLLMLQRNRRSKIIRAEILRRV